MEAKPPVHGAGDRAKLANEGGRGSLASRCYEQRDYGLGTRPIHREDDVVLRE